LLDQRLRCVVCFGFYAVHVHVAFPCFTFVSMSLYFMRHGEREDFVDREWKEKAQEFGGNPDDPPLSAAGRLQAHDTALSLQRYLRQSKVDPKNVVILSSPCV
jgi:broad specificity phosphatase PhoE